jgi:hypothetical protein
MKFLYNYFDSIQQKTAGFVKNPASWRWAVAWGIMRMSFLHRDVGQLTDTGYVF